MLTVMWLTVILFNMQEYYLYVLKEYKHWIVSNWHSRIKMALCKRRFMLDGEHYNAMSFDG